MLKSSVYNQYGAIINDDSYNITKQQRSLHKDIIVNRLSKRIINAYFILCFAITLLVFDIVLMIIQKYENNRIVINTRSLTEYIESLNNSNTNLLVTLMMSNTTSNTTLK